MFLYFAVCGLLFVPFAVAIFVRRFVCVAGWRCCLVVGNNDGTNFESWCVGCGQVAENGCREDRAFGGDLSGRGWNTRKKREIAGFNGFSRFRNILE